MGVDYATGLSQTVHLKWTTCITCGVPIAMPAELMEHRQKDGRTYWCVNGHRQNFILGETKEQKLARQLRFSEARNERLRMERDAESRSKAAIKGHLTRTKNRVAHGVCPVPECQRHFDDLQAHIASKHPGYAEGGA